MVGAGQWGGVGCPHMDAPAVVGGAVVSGTEVGVCVCDSGVWGRCLQAPAEVEEGSAEPSADHLVACLCTSVVRQQRSPWMSCLGSGCACAPDVHARCALRCARLSTVEVGRSTVQCNSAACMHACIIFTVMPPVHNRNSEMVSHPSPPAMGVAFGSSTPCVSWERVLISEPLPKSFIFKVVKLLMIGAVDVNAGCTTVPCIPFPFSAAPR